MTQDLTETLAGVAVIIIAMAFITFAYTKNLGTTANIDSYRVNARFQNVEGITSGSNVSIAGVKVGIVETITLDHETFDAILTLSIQKDIKLSVDSRASVVTSGLLGGKIITITPGMEEKYITDGSYIKYTQSTFNIESLIGKIMYSIGGNNK